MRDLFTGGNRNFDARGTYEFCDADRGACRTRLLEVGRVDSVHSWKQRHIGEIHLYGDGVIETHSRLFQNKTDIVEGLLYFGLELFRNLTCFQVTAGLSGDIERIADENTGTKWP